MQELFDVLKAHAIRYPLMEPADAVKLIYQNEFGGGHMVSNEDACIEYLRREYDTVSHDANAPLVESIGNGIVRIHLAAISKDQVDALGKAFIRSAQRQQGSMDDFLKKLACLRNLCAEGAFAFDFQTLDAYLMEYKQAGYPAVSHSEAYRKAYHPAYRIVKKAEFD